MYAVIDFGGKQYKVEKGDEVIVDRIDLDEGKTMTVSPVLLVGGKRAVTATELKSVKVKARVEEHLLGDKILVFKYKAKKGYRRRKGHRSRLSRISIQAITGGKATETKGGAKPKAEAEAKAETKEKAKAGTAKKPKAKAKPEKKPKAKAKPKPKPKAKAEPKAKTKAKPAKKTAKDTKKKAEK